jgi:hypothetical protein
VCVTGRPILGGGVHGERRWSTTGGGLNAIARSSARRSSAMVLLHTVRAVHDGPDGGVDVSHARRVAR